MRTITERIKRLFLIILLTLIFTGCSMADELPNQSGPYISERVGEETVQSADTAAESMEETESAQGTMQTEELIPENPSVTVVCAGDNLVHSPIYKQAAARAADGGYDFSPVYEDTADVIMAADLAILNQETIITDEFEPSNYPTFCTPAAMGDEIAKLGFDAVSISNNHVLDKGESGLLSTLGYWETEHPEILVYGASADDVEIPVIEVNGITFAFLGFMEHTNGLYLPEGSQCRITYLSEAAEVERQVRLAAELADCVIVSVHYGLEVSGEVTQEQLSVTQSLGDWGADIIIGTQPHTVQPMEFFRTARGTQAFVFYCLGNYASAMDNPLAMVGILGSIIVTKDISTNEITLSSPEAIPIITHYDSGYQNVRIYKWSNYTRELAASHGCAGFSYEYAEELIARQAVIRDYLDTDTEYAHDAVLLEERLNEIALSEDAVGMSVAVFSGGDIVYTYNYGYADKENNVLCSEDTVYRTASVSKLISTVALMTLYDEGLLTPESGLQELTGLPYDNPKTGEEVRLWHLLTHTAGIYDSSTYTTAQTYYYTTEYVLSQSHNSSAVGSTYLYTNFGMGTVGSIVELLTGEFFHDYADRILFSPLGMNAAYTTDLLSDSSRAANIYTDGMLAYRPSSWQRTSEYYEKFGLGNSYLTAQCELLISCPDLARFGIALAGDGTVDGTRILSADAVNLINKSWFSSEEFDMGLSVRIYDDTLVRGRTIYGHPGQALGNLCGLYYDISDGTGVAICTSGCHIAENDNGVYTLLDSTVNAVYEILLGN